MGMVKEGQAFVDRRDAGFEVAKLLEEKYKDQNALILGIPRGGIVIAYEIAMVLRCELSVVVTKKLPHPHQEELAIGAVAEDGSIFLTSMARGIADLTLQNIVKAQEKEIQSRIQRFRKGRPLPSLENRVVIIADDGIATGSTIVPAIKLCMARNAAKIIVAAPVSGDDYAQEINALADEVVVAERPPFFYAVGQVYEDFSPLSDDEATGLLDDYEKIAAKIRNQPG